MSKFSDKFIDGMSLVAEKVDENRFLGAIKDSFTIYMQLIRFCNMGSQSNKKHFWSRIRAKIKTLVAP